MLKIIQSKKAKKKQQKSKVQH